MNNNKYLSQSAAALTSGINLPTLGTDEHVRISIILIYLYVTCLVRSFLHAFDREAKLTTFLIIDCAFFCQTREEVIKLQLQFSYCAK